MKAILILLALDPFCLKIPHIAWYVSIDRAVNTARDTYGIKEPFLSKLRACLLKSMPEAK
jgi:hypothetical protein